eukprot:SAG11_NODE_161_length_14021_cov_36.845065_7_plen_44_part_00
MEGVEAPTEAATMELMIELRQKHRRESRSRLLEAIRCIRHGYV